jgi:cobalamin biosynthesis Mg chelatase CobN
MDNKFRLHIVPPESSLDLETLVHTGGNVSAKDLRKALEEGKIDQQKYLELLTELLERTEKKLEETELSLGQA